MSCGLRVAGCEPRNSQRATRNRIQSAPMKRIVFAILLSAVIARAKEQSKLFISGNRQLETSIRSWFTLSPFAKVEIAIECARIAFQIIRSIEL